jgi:hypothetical protein
MIGAGIFMAAVAWLGCVGWYSIRAKWWRNVYGINTWLVSFTIAVAMIRLAVVTLYPHLYDTQVSDLVGLSTYLLLAFAGFQRTYLIEKAQQEGEANYHRRVTDHMS